MKSKKQVYIAPLISSGITVLLLIWIFTLQKDIELSLFYSRLFVPVARIMLLVGIGLVIGEVIEATGWTKHLAVLAMPLFRFGRLGQRCGAAFTTAFFSGVSANALLVNFYQENKISRKQLYLTNFVNHFPAFFLHLPTTLFIVLPLAGWAGGIYMLLVFAAILLRVFCFLIYGRLTLNRETEEVQEDLNITGQKNEWGFLYIVRRIRDKLPGRFLRIAQFVIPIYMLIFLAKAIGLFEAMRELLAGSSISGAIPVESMSVVVIAFLADYTSGFTTAGALLRNGVLTMSQGVLAMLLGNIVAFPLRALRHQLPRYMGIFSPKMGSQILFLGQTFRVLSLGLVGGLYAMLS